MADFVFNNAKGRLRTFFELPAAADAIIAVWLETTGLEADATLKDYDDLQALLAGTSNEQTVMGRKTITASVTVTINDTTDVVDFDIPDQTYAAAGGNPVSKWLSCYDGDTAAGTDANIVPMTAHDYVETPTGSDIIVTIAATGLARAS